MKRSAKYIMKYKGGASIPPVKKPPKNCHDNQHNDPYNFFEQVPIPTDNWQKVYNYTIYPNKEMYRKCLSEYIALKTCATRFKEEEVHPPVNPIVVIPGLLGPEDDVYNVCICIYFLLILNLSLKMYLNFFLYFVYSIGMTVREGFMMDASQKNCAFRQLTFSEGTSIVSALTN